MHKNLMENQGKAIGHYRRFVTTENCPSPPISGGDRRTFCYRFTYEISKNGLGNHWGFDFSAPRTTRLTRCLSFTLFFKEWLGESVGFDFGAPRTTRTFMAPFQFAKFARYGTFTKVIFLINKYSPLTLSSGFPSSPFLNILNSN